MKPFVLLQASPARLAGKLHAGQFDLKAVGVSSSLFPGSIGFLGRGPGQSSFSMRMPLAMQKGEMFLQFKPWLCVP